MDEFPENQRLARNYRILSSRPTRAEAKKGAGEARTAPLRKQRAAGSGQRALKSLPQSKALAQLIRAEREFPFGASHLGIFRQRTQPKLRTHVIQRTPKQRLPVCPG